VHVVTSDALDGTDRIADRFETIDGVSIRRVPNLSNWLAWKYKIFVPLGFGPAFRSALRTADIVHLFDFRDLQNAMAYMSMRRTRTAFVLSAFGELPRAEGPKRWAKHVYDLLWGYRTINKASALVAQTDNEAEWYERFGALPGKIRNIPLAVDLDTIRRPPARGAFRARIGVAPYELMILFLGRIHEYKGVDLLIRAYGRVRAERPNVRLVIAGRDDGFLAAAKRLATELGPPGAVLFCGPLYGENRLEAYADADLFALTPSHAEQTSLAALEACACGTPVLVTRQAPIPGLDASFAGLTVASDDAAVTASLSRLLSDNLKAMGERAAALVRQRFALPVVAAALEDVYFAASSAPRAPSSKLA
jgi:glycosyltransferase involved in cell wall biosynthesis